MQAQLSIRALSMLQILSQSSRSTSQIAEHCRRADLTLSSGQCHTTLRHLRERGYVMETERRASNAIGRRVIQRYWRITPDGDYQLRRSLRQLDQLRAAATDANRTGGIRTDAPDASDANCIDGMLR